MDSYRIAAIDVHKSMLAVVVTDAAVEGELPLERRKFGALGSDLKALAEWLAAQQVQEVVMESTAQYWKPVWRQLEGQCQLHLAQAHSNRARKGRKDDFRDAERLARRHLSGELILSFVPDPEQRLWRTLTRSKHQLTRDRVRLHSQLEALLEDARIKLSTCVTDLLGVSSRRMMEQLAQGATDPALLAALADPMLRATAETLTDALSGAAEMSTLHRQILRLFLDRLELMERQMEVLDRTIAATLQLHQDAVVRLAAVPGLGVDSAQQIIAELGPQAATFRRSAGISKSGGLARVRPFAAT
jgi:transposase